MNPVRINIYKIGNDYVLINRKLYRLEELDDDQIAEAFNQGDALPLISAPLVHEEEV